MKYLVRRALDLILKNEPIIIPTDTVYGLICRYDSKKAVEKIYKLKKRDWKKPLILLGYNWKALKKFVKIQKQDVKAIHKLLLLIKQWPGPLTLIMPASKYVPKLLNKGYKTIGLRVPNNKFLLKLLEQCPGQVLASTSANISGKPSRQPQKELLRKVRLFIRAKKGEMSFKPSRIIQVTEKENKVLRK